MPIRIVTVEGIKKSASNGSITYGNFSTFSGVTLQHKKKLGKVSKADEAAETYLKLSTKLV